MVLANYGKLCKLIGVPVNAHINDILRGGEEEEELVNATLLQPPTASGGLNIAYLELLDSDIGPDGCKVLGETLKSHTQPGLLTMKLKYNRAIGDAGVSALCDGLFTNTVLKQLHLDYCGIGPDGAIKLAQLVSIRSSVIETLSLQGNSLGDDGLYHLSLGLARSITLVTLNLSDNSIRHSTEALTAFRDALTRAKALAHIDFTFNHIEIDGANILLPALAPENTKIQSFQVDASLPGDLFTLLNRAPKADGKKKGGKKKGGSKKKK
uniref:Uncharacterized protein n=1 Tax=Globisporangium ultimum (strain ATCC 200006 / CBS 805.95 / DAOM BR144) TaxID=431595 RepID=K3WLM3_GLOUD